MKRLILFLSSALVIGAVFASQIDIPSKQIVARAYGVQDSRTLTNITTRIGGTNKYVVIIDGGAWSISNNVTFGTNVALYVTPESYFDISVGSTVTVNGAWLADATMKFTGSGIATGDASFPYRHPSWGSETQYNIGTGFLQSWAIAYIATNSVGLQTNDLFRYLGTILETNNLVDNGGFVLSTNQYDVNGGPLLTTSGDRYSDFCSITSDSLYSLEGFWPQYSDTNTVVFSNGWGWVNGYYLYLTNPVSYTITANLGSHENNLYLYIDYSSCTSLYNVAFLDKTNPPSWSKEKRGWYNGDDRVVSCLRVHGNGLSPFGMGDGGYMVISNHFGLGAATDPTGFAITPTTNTSVLLPVNAIEAQVFVQGQDADDLGSVFAQSYEVSIITPFTGYRAGIQEFADSGTIQVTDWIQLGPSRNITFGGDDDDDNGQLFMYIVGWRIGR